jgi:Tripartite tricarboxylate transporter TctB family
MLNQNLVRGAFLAAVALAFGLGALRYQLGSLGHAGPGMFPLIVSSLLLIVAILTIVQSRFIPSVPLDMNFKNIVLIMLSLVAFVAFAKFVNIVVGIVAMVFISSQAAASWSWKRNLQISAGLIAVAYGFEKLLGLNLRLPLI